MTSDSGLELEHLRYLAGDPLIAWLCGLARFPTARTVGNWLRQLTQTTLAPLIQLNHEMDIDTVKRLALPRRLELQSGKES